MSTQVDTILPTFTKSQWSHVSWKLGPRAAMGAQGPSIFFTPTAGFKQ